ncbi:MAG TPA: hypothetical protein VIY48_01180 [Candidatus Paceibacterota bacterium]
MSNMEEGGMFPQHPRNTEWETLEGKMMAPHIAAPMESTASGDSRHQTSTGMTSWNSTITVNTGQTGGGGAMAH